jgi:hypothetical protein
MAFDEKYFDEMAFDEVVWNHVVNIHGINPSFFDFFRFMPWHKSDAKKGYFFAFIPGQNRNIFFYGRALYPGFTVQNNFERVH